MTIEEAEKILDEYAKNPEEEDDGYYSPSLVAIEKARNLIRANPTNEPNWICWEGEGGIVVYFLEKLVRLEWDKEGKLSHNISYFHFMSKISSGWKAPLELEDEEVRPSSYVIDQGEADYYLVDVCRHKHGSFSDTQTMLVVRKGDNLVLSINGHTIEFTRRRDKRPYPYVGNLEHRDFSGKFVEIMPEPDNLGRLFSETGYIIIGCDPWTNYKGVEKFSPPA